jgi:ElaB/YqjD/DUF883 family membrane-anchored ribosome-binding protein
VQEATQAAARELGQEAAQELVNTVQQSEGSTQLSNIETNVDLYVVIHRVANILLAADFPWGEMQLAGDDPTVAFMGGLPTIKKALKDATQMVKGSLTSMENELEDAKNTAQKPFQGNADVAATAAQKLENHIANLVSEIRSEGKSIGEVAIGDTTRKIDEAMQKAVQDATQVIKQEAADWARANAETVKDAVHKAVQKVKDAVQEVQTAVQDAMAQIKLRVSHDLYDAGIECKFPGHWDRIEPMVQGAVPEVVQDTTQWVQTRANTALQKALQKLQWRDTMHHLNAPGQEVQKVVRKAAQDATEDAVSKILKIVQDCVPGAVVKVKADCMATATRPGGPDPGYFPGHGGRPHPPL